MAPSREELTELILALLPAPPDFELLNHGTVSLLYPLTDRAKQWMEQSLPVDNPHTQFLGTGVVIESRYVLSIMQGIVSDGLTIR